MSAVAADAAAAAFPRSSWAMLERFVFRRDDESSFPDATAAPLRASGTTSWGATFTVAFRLAAPPRVSRLYAHLPGFPDPREEVPLLLMSRCLLGAGNDVDDDGLLVVLQS
ncbi:hypothetical protein EJB05_15337, partial [Eragrostis curvula]